ncbi:hypothetical protein VD0002_g5049 [Verticillium dahliae]|uniref:Uncharacterized protein n=1 Tax=Verticillium dahliae TaxID=27337 RepID=A0AA44WB70_VERDA|nr:RTA1 like protein-domain-containing protein [Verticillium dahliae]PNH28316.1 hypothetical protein BJF96_g8394 [Verticillium dahliae]PNH54044.1 hypothetical protein VD0003_g3426 [Verticillium dahliae]PNH63239.1 hypothetical protein VD0002_g5049 [Verticillium dahliae]
MSDAHNETIRRPFDECSEISIYCPVEATVLGYYPNVGANIFFAVAFGIVTIVSGYIGIKKRTWAYMAAVTGGALLETAGYAGRVLLNDNPWNSDAFQLQICAIILAPTMLCVAIYLTLKHVALALSPPLSRIRPRLYPWIFLPADLSCLVLQAIGGGVSAAAGRTNAALLSHGNRMIISGVALQVVVLLFFGIMGVDYWVRVRRWVRDGDGPDAGALAVYRDGRFRKFVCGIAGAFTAIIIRCVYRIVEMAGGWGNHIMQDEISFMILDATLVLVAVSLLTAFHPGIFFPQMAGTRKAKSGAASPEEGVVTESKSVATSSKEGSKTEESGRESA